MRIDVGALSDPERLLFSSYGVTAPGHIDLEGIAADQGIDVVYRALDGCEARLVRVGDRGVVSVNSASGNLGRRRFSLAHEIAHWIRDRDRTAFACSSDDISPHDAGAKSIETSANAYAGQLVLPDYLVRQHMGDRPASLSHAQSIGKTFEASMTAAAIKLIRLTREPACIAVHRQGTLRWFRKSEMFPSEFYLIPELDPDAEAFTMAFDGSRSMTNSRRGPAHRWLSGPGVQRREIEYQSLGMGGGETLTLFKIVR